MTAKQFIETVDESDAALILHAAVWCMDTPNGVFKLGLSVPEGVRLRHILRAGIRDFAGTPRTPESVGGGFKLDDYVWFSTREGVRAIGRINSHNDNGTLFLYRYGMVFTTTHSEEHPTISGVSTEDLAQHLADEATLLHTPTPPAAPPVQRWSDTWSHVELIEAVMEDILRYIPVDHRDGLRNEVSEAIAASSINEAAWKDIWAEFAVRLFKSVADELSAPAGARQPLDKATPIATLYQRKLSGQTPSRQEWVDTAREAEREGGWRNVMAHYIAYVPIHIHDGNHEMATRYAVWATADCASWPHMSDVKARDEARLVQLTTLVEVIHGRAHTKRQ